eukprot:COSAG04_NODE_738_length_10699_cov_72.861604_2_plen_197_part_00
MICCRFKSMQFSSSHSPPAPHPPPQPPPSRASPKPGRLQGWPNTHIHTTTASGCKSACWACGSASALQLLLKRPARSLAWACIMALDHVAHFVVPFLDNLAAKHLHARVCHADEHRDAGETTAAVPQLAPRGSPIFLVEETTLACAWCAWVRAGRVGERRLWEASTADMPPSGACRAHRRPSRPPEYGKAANAPIV